ncbi:SAVED domain-containing protein [Fluviicola taffensis]|uniref:SMODS-associated and fused to various effectors domain-containing protein n=1 Tax=Fluviicola taffensis (strain DSM 16823 / NCIMB 13979 / RW262) TaxID=755732 RepID=F2IEA8_FLUTR|nr:SAVED domain-containing protein [Fluviicola taffensis]AEA42426.1 hypothetical protein Fluta_0419 [Fluviicola taffensis DSM 16823]
MKKDKIKYLVIAHDILAEISDTQIQEALQENADASEIEIIRFKTRLELGDTHGFGWQERKTIQSDYFSEEVLPKLNENPNAVIAYFGLAPIPLAIHLGYLVSGLKNVRVFQKHHDQKNWKWTKTPTSIEIVSENVPKDYFKATGDVILTCSASYPIHIESLDDIIIDPLKEISLTTKETHRDVFTSEKSLNDYASAFRDVIDSIANCLPEISGIHLFSAIPTGLAFLLGQEIQPNIHPEITVYEYKKDSDIGYQETFVIQRQPFIERMVPDNEKKFITEFREKLESHLHNDVKAFLEMLQEKKADSWIDELFPQSSVRNLFHQNYWLKLASLHKTRLLKSSFSDKGFDAGETQFFVNNRWYLSDSLIHTLKTRISDESDLKTAFRLFWFHESIHDHSHKIHSGNTEGIGRYPKIIEEADYQADVYALLHDLAFHPTTKSNIVQFVTKKIELAILTMWAFDDLNPGTRLQVRRIGRYLIWYFQLLRIQDFCDTLDNILEALSEKPVIELRMVGITSPDKQRLELELTNYKKEDLAIAVFHENKFRSFPFNHGQLSLDQLMDGFKNHDHEKIIGVMRQLVHELFSLE